MRLDTDSRGASIAITHALAVGITALLVSGLLVGAGNYLDQQQRTVAREQLSDVGSDVVDKINRLDGLNATGENVSVTLHPTYPRTVAAEPYLVEIRTSGPTEGTLLVRSSTLHRPLRFPVNTSTQLNPTSLSTTGARGGSPTLSLCGPTASESAHIRLGDCS
ncbi:hypothetical protein ACKVMT_01555 [Halobacteriales archaeon Cl-PHB]